MLAPRAGYYRPNLQTDLIMECLNKDVCHGGDQDNLNGYCRYGYTGMMCGSCKQDFTKKGWRHCQECFQSIGSNIFTAIAQLFKFVGLIYLIQWLATTYADTKNERYRNFLI